MRRDSSRSPRGTPAAPPASRELARATRAAIAHRAAKRALGALRQIAGDLAAAGAELDVVGTYTVADAGGEEAVADAVRLARHRHGTIDVVLVKRPGRHTPEPTERQRRTSQP